MFWLFSFKIELNWYRHEKIFLTYSNIYGLALFCCCCNCEPMLHSGCFQLHQALIPRLITENSGSHMRGHRNTGWTLTLVLQPVCATISLLLVLHGNRTLWTMSRNNNYYIIACKLKFVLVWDKLSALDCQNKRTPWIVAM